MLAAINTKKINCDVLAQLIVYLCAYNNRPNNVNAAVVDVHGKNLPVFLPQTGIVRTGLKIEMNVKGHVAGVFFSSGHRVACVNGICFDLITGKKGAQAAMNTAYIRCTKLPEPPAGRFAFTYLGNPRHLALQSGSPAQGLAKFTCT